jgi:NDP-mannose synthase
VKRAVVLAGGLGTRLRPYTTVLPKPLMPVGDRPVLDIVVRQLHHHGFERVTIATGYLAELIEAYFGDGHGYNVHIDYFREQEPLGTVGALSLIEELEDDFLVMNGDVLTDIDYAGFLQRHSDSDATATIATQLREVQISLGVLRFDTENGDTTRVTDYVEKPTIENEVSMGIYCFSPSVLGHIDRGERLDFPNLILRLIEQGQVVRAWRSEDYWLDIGRHDDYERAMDEFERMRDRLIPAD